MIKVENGNVTIGVVKNPLTEVMMEIDKNTMIKFELKVDMFCLFSSILTELSKGELAEIIESALNDAITMKEQG